MKAVFCVPALVRPSTPFIEAMEKAIQPVIDAGWDEAIVFEIGCPYISNARATMLRKALSANADVIVFLDYDLSFNEGALLRLIQTPDHVVSGAYRFKCDEEKYMGRLIEDERGRPIVREDGCVKAEWIPAGFLKITKEAVDHFMAAYPELVYGPYYSPSVDIFNHGAKDRLWWGEDYAFSRRWAECGGDIWVIPDLDITHHTIAPDGSSTGAFPGNFHRYLLKQPARSSKSTLSLVEAA